MTPLVLEAGAALAGMVLLHPFEDPPALPPGLRVVIMSPAGEIDGRWQWSDVVDWWRAAAYRIDEDGRHQACEDCGLLGVPVNRYGKDFGLPIGECEVCGADLDGADPW